MARLGDVCEIVSGATPKTTQKRYWGGDIAWATPKDLSVLRSKEIDSTERTITADGLRSSSARVLPEGSVLLSSRAPIGLVAINTVPMATNQGFKSLVPDPDAASADYLYWWLRANTSALQSLGRGATFTEISKSIVADISVPLPPIADQRRIAAVLDKCQGLIDHRRQSLSDVATLVHVAFLNRFGDPGAGSSGKWTTLNDLVRDGDAINYGVVQPGEHVDGGRPLIRVSDLRDGRVQHSSVKLIASAIDAKYSRSRLRGDEILLSCVGTTGAIALASEREAGWNIARAVARIPLSDEVSREYVAAFLAMPTTQRYFQNELRTVSQPTLNIKQIRETRIMLPDQSAQREFVDVMRRTEALRDRCNASAQQLSALMSSIQNRAFRGEL